jgi:hypothetical protein
MTFGRDESGGCTCGGYNENCYRCAGTGIVAADPWERDTDARSCLPDQQSKASTELSTAPLGLLHRLVLAITRWF